MAQIRWLARPVTRRSAILATAAAVMSAGCAGQQAPARTSAATNAGTAAASPSARASSLPGPGTWTPAPGMPVLAGGQTATTLPDGRVLLAGGQQPRHGDPTAAAEIYDPASGKWSSTGDMTTPRWAHTATVLLDGTVLVTGGFAGSEQKVKLSSAEIYDPTSGAWTAIGDMGVARAGHTATRLADGRVLVTGGNPGSAVAELYFRNERLATSDCSNNPEPGAGFGAKNLVSALAKRSGLKASAPIRVAVGGLSGWQVDLAVASNWTTSCPESNGAPAVPTVQNGEAHWWLVASDRTRYIVLDDPQGGNILIELTAAPADTFETHLAASLPIIESFRFDVGP
jgi:Kelch motif